MQQRASHYPRPDARREHVPVCERRMNAATTDDIAVTILDITYRSRILGIVDGSSVAFVVGVKQEHHNGD